MPTDPMFSRRVRALLDRLPSLRLDPDAAEPGYIGLYERGVTEIPVLFDPPDGRNAT